MAPAPVIEFEVMPAQISPASGRALDAPAETRMSLRANAPGLLTVLLVIVSWALSVWVDHIASYDAVYGTFGSLIVIMLWFYLSTIALVIGGFINGELEREAGAPASDRSMY